MDTVFYLFSNCIPVKGYKRSIIYDLTRCEYRFIPNSLHEILEKFHGKSINFVKNFYKNHDSIIDEYFTFLLENDYIFFGNKNESKRFPKLEYVWDYPSKISNCILEIESSFLINLESLIKDLNNLKCKHIHLFYKTSLNDLNELKKVVEIINHLPFKSVKISLPYTEEKNNLNELTNICEDNINISEIIFYNSPYEKNVIPNISTKFTYIKDNKYNSAKKHLKDFHVNMNLFMESQKHNTFFNRKLIISSLGFITNSIENKRDQWDFKNESLLKVTSSNKFRENWFVNKDSIKICQDCEFRYMCVDSRTPLKLEKENKWYFNTKCSYDPYKAEWEN
ncbi:grasp-with-spasm system SPASM domain peptide maturase [Tenacibaculum ovolyticum]|uniref:grasp-with-spasm system SPASM domain peptide maturase n=1 Tax=Tenacibaculum ovolyticum TaxID=104270 RepID=UPI001EEE5841|nr:grasp-with-spasm system SPASM domain peptide maturase [Tenacibaculum ovolyticum]